MTEAGGPAPPPPAKAGHARRLLILLLALGVIVAVSGLVTWELGRPTALTVSEGLVMGRFAGDFLNTSNSISPLSRTLNATSFANETGQTASTPSAILTLRSTIYAFSDGERLIVDLGFSIQGTFASNLRLQDLRLGLNNTSGAAGNPFLFPSDASGTNVSYDFSQGGIALSPPNSLGLMNQTQGGPRYNFEFSDVATFTLTSYSGVHFFGFQATVEGHIAPSVGVGIIVEFINTVP